MGRMSFDPDMEHELDNIMEDLIVGHNFEYARKAILALLIRSKIDELRSEQMTNYEAKRSRRISELEDDLKEYESRDD